MIVQLSNTDLVRNEGKKTTLLPLLLTSEAEVEALSGDVTGRQGDANGKGR